MTTRFLSMFLAFAVLATTGCGLGRAPGAALGRDGRLAARGAVGGEGAAPWTVFVYMAADNDLAPEAHVDLREMEHGLRGRDVRIVAFVDQDEKGDSRIYEITPDADWKTLASKTVDDGGAVIPAGNEVDSGSPQTLEKFIRWGTKRYPSRRSMLVMWNHGNAAFAGPDEGIKSFCSDHQAGTRMTLAQLSDVARRVGDVQRFDVVGLDMCLLGHVEAAYQLAPLADYMVASEKSYPGAGWDYHALALRLSREPGMSPRDVAAQVVEDNAEFYQREVDETTLSAVDLAALRTQLMPRLDRLAGAMREALPNQDAYWGIRRALARAYALSAGPQNERSAIDLGLALRLLAAEPDVPEAIQAQAGEVLEAYYDAIVANRTTLLSPEVYTGLKIYFHPDGYKAIYGDVARQAFGGTAWNQFLVAYHQK